MKMKKYILRWVELGRWETTVTARTKEGALKKIFSKQAIENAEQKDTRFKSLLLEATEIVSIWSK